MELGDDCPSREIWLDDEALASYFESVKQGWHNPGSSSSSLDEEVPLMTTDDPLIEMWRGRV